MATGWLKFIWVVYLGEQDRDTVGDQQMLPKVCLMFYFLKPTDWCMATYHIFNIRYLLWLYLLLCVMKYSTLKRKLKMPHQGEGRDWRRLTGCTGNCKLKKQWKDHGWPEKFEESCGRDWIEGKPWVRRGFQEASGQRGDDQGPKALSLGRKESSSEAEQKEQWEESRS